MRAACPSRPQARHILLDAEGNAYISDFGVARSLAGNGMTRSGAIVGTPDYVSPEQARGDASMRAATCIPSA
jgi:serine/threonine protein kinase